MRTAVALFSIFLSPVSAVAQPSASEAGAPATAHRFEIFGTIGHGLLFHGDSLWGSGLAWGGGAGVRPLPGWFDRIGFECGVARLEDQTARGNFAQWLQASLVTTTVQYHFRGDTRVQPFVSGGLGYVSADHTQECTECAFDLDPLTGRRTSRGGLRWRSHGTKFGIAAGAGVKVALRRHLAIRADLLITDTTPGTGYNWGWLQPQVGLAARF
jgi:hypothetical protein